tara:strand:+ start:700 stop:1335 length:636 start_codon:yes stop_codon:yes gene_type:complete
MGSRRREEERLRRESLVSGDQSYVMGGGDIVRDLSGGGVLTTIGVQRAEESRQQELDTLISRRTGGQGDPEAEKRQMAIQQLEKRKEKTLPGFLGAVYRMNIERQLADLRAGGTPQFGLSPTGTFITQGVIPKGGVAPGSQPNIQPIFDTQQRADVTPLVTPEVTPEVTSEVVPDGTIQIGSRDRFRRRTKSTRVGGAANYESLLGSTTRV